MRTGRLTTPEEVAAWEARYAEKCAQPEAAQLGPDDLELMWPAGMDNALEEAKLHYPFRCTKAQALAVILHVGIERVQRALDEATKEHRLAGALEDARALQPLTVPGSGAPAARPRSRAPILNTFKPRLWLLDGGLVGCHSLSELCAEARAASNDAAVADELRKLQEG